MREKSHEPVTGDETGLDRLSHTVEHPGGSSSLGVTGEPLLGDDGTGVTLGTSEVTELLVVGVRLVLVVRDGRSSVELEGMASRSERS